MANKPLKILSTPVDKGGCGWYRVRQPFEALSLYTDSDSHVIEKESDDMMQVAAALTQADILVVRQGGEQGIEALKGAADAFAKESGLKQGFHAKIVIDIDDNMELISPYSEHYGEYGTIDFYDRNVKKWIWKHGETASFDLIKNRAKVLSFMYGLKKADLVTVTTEHLANYARLFNKSVAVLPNTINENVWWKPPFTKNKQLRVGWSGGHSHYEDWYSIKEPLNHLMRTYKFKLIFSGTGFSGLIDDDLKYLVEEHPWVPFEAHSYKTMLLNLDLAIIPLSQSSFNSYKSAIKYFEFSAAGVPCVVANITPYKQVVDGKKAFPYDTQKEFVSQMERAIQQPVLREKLGNTARDYILKNYTSKIWAQKYSDTYSAIL